MPGSAPPALESAPHRERLDDREVLPPPGRTPGRAVPTGAGE
ncbi:hypothetical protein ABZ464_41945 [Streptomyces sp. NPDC005820]